MQDSRDNSCGLQYFDRVTGNPRYDPTLPFARPVEVADGAHFTSGILSCVALQRASARDVPQLIWRALAKSGKVTNHNQIAAFSGCKEVKVETLNGDPLPLHVDGDYIGTVDTATFTVAPQILNVVS